MRGSVKTLLLVSAATMIGAASGAEAQDTAGVASTTTAGPTPEVAPDGQDRSGLQDIIVTAERRTSTLQSAPLSVAAFDAAEIQKRDASQVSELLRLVPGVSLAQTAKGGQIFIRGVGGALDSQIGSPAVNLNFDGRYQGQAAPVFASLYDINRVEVLRGPQGTLYGRNATAGSINIISNDPVLEDAAGVLATYGNYDAARIEAMANAELSSAVAVRVTGAYDKHDGYYSNGYGNINNLGGRIKLLFQPSDSTRLVLSGDVSRMRGIPGYTDILPLRDGHEAWDTNAPSIGYEHAKAWSAAGQLDQDLGFAKLTALANYQSFDLDFYRYFAANLGDQTSSDDQFSAEVRLASQPSSPISWVAGLFYLDGDKSDLVFTPGPNATTDYPSIKQKSWAGFGEVRVPIGDKVTAFGGARYTEDTQRNRGRIYPGPPDDANATPYFTPRVKFTHFDYRAGAELKFSARSMIYASYSTGYKAGGLFQGDAPNTFRPEKLKAAAVGTKNRFAHNRIQINAEVFHYDYSDYQVQTIGFLNPVGIGLTIYNAASAKIEGGEVETVFLVTPRDRLDLSAAVLHGKFGGNFVVASAFGPPSDYSHFEMPQTPDVVLSAAYEHTFDLGRSGNVVLRGDGRYSDGFWPEYSHLPNTHQGSFFKANASLQWNSANGRTFVRAFMTNITNEPVIESAFVVPMAPVTAQLGAPRTYGLTVSQRF